MRNNHPFGSDPSKRGTSSLKARKAWFGANLPPLLSGCKEPETKELELSRSGVVCRHSAQRFVPPTSCVVGEHCVTNRNDLTFDAGLFQTEPSIAVEILAQHF